MENENKVDPEDWERVHYRMDAEGFHYCFDGYSSWKEIEDEKFQTLRKAYIDAAEQLETYINEQVEYARNQSVQDD